VAEGQGVPTQMSATSLRSIASSGDSAARSRPRPAQARATMSPRPWFNDRRTALFDGVDLVGIDVDADHVMSVTAQGTLLSRIPRIPSQRR
jgi:hypothetical protein